MNEVPAQIRLLAVFHYVLSALAALFGLFPLIHVAVGIGILGGRFEGRGGPPPFLGCSLWEWVSR